MHLHPKPAAAMALVNSMDDWEAADFIESLAKHFHGYDLDATLPRRLREDATPHGNCDQIHDDRKENVG